MPLNISGSIVNASIADTLDTEGIVKRGLLLHLDADSLDSYPGNDITYDISTNTNNGTMYNGTAVSFDATNDYITIGALDDPPRGAGSITAWFKPPSTSPTVGTIIDSQGGWFVLQRVGYSLNFVAGSTPHGYNAGSMSIGNWNFVCGTYDGDIRIYINGVQVGSTYTAPSGNIEGNSFTIHPSGTGAAEISDVRVWKTKLTDAEISELYRSPNTVIPGNQTAGNLVGWWPLTEGNGSTAYDGSGNENHGTLTNGPSWVGGQTDIPQLAGKGHSRKMFFDGSNDYVDLGTASALLNPGKEVTVSMWIMPHPDTLVNTFALNNSTANQSTSPYSIKFNNFAHPTFTINTAAGATGTGESWSIGSNVWIHLVGTYNSDAAKIDIWENGVRKVSNSVGGSNGVIYAYPSNAQNNMRIGANGGYEGLIDEICIWNKELTQAEIQSLATTSGGVPKPPDARTIREDNLLGYWRNDGVGTWKDLSGQENDGTVAGSPAQVSFPEGTTSKRDSQGFPSKISSFGFDGSSSYITLPSLDVTGSRTISMWFYTNVKGTGFLFQGGDGTDQFSINISTSNGSSTSLVRAQANDSSSGYGTYAKDTSNGSIETGKWYNITATKTTGVVQNMYLNGVNDTSAGSNWHYTPDVSYIIGKRNESGGNWVNGKVATFTLYNRVLQASEILHNFNAQRDRFGV